MDFLRSWKIFQATKFYVDENQRLVKTSKKVENASKKRKKKKVNDDVTVVIEPQEGISNVAKQSEDKPTTTKKETASAAAAATEIEFVSKPMKKKFGEVGATEASMRKRKSH